MAQKSKPAHARTRRCGFLLMSGTSQSARIFASANSVLSCRNGQSTLSALRRASSSRPPRGVRHLKVTHQAVAEEEVGEVAERGVPLVVLLLLGRRLLRGPKGELAV